MKMVKAALATWVNGWISVIIGRRSQQARSRPGGGTRRAIGSFAQTYQVAVSIYGGVEHTIPDGGVFRPWRNQTPAM
jgi:hypothetical protein